MIESIVDSLLEAIASNLDLPYVETFIETEATEVVMWQARTFWTASPNRGNLRLTLESISGTSSDGVIIRVSR